MMAYVPGELKPFFGKKETVYGQTPTSSLDFLGMAVDAQFKHELHQTKDTWSESRFYAPKSCVLEQEEAAVQISARLLSPESGYDPIAGLIEGALGTAGGTSPLGRLPSYSMLVEITQGATQGLYLLNGGKVKSLTIDVPNQGARPLLQAEIWARHAEKVGAGRVVSGFQSLTLPAAPAVPNTYALQWKAPVTLISGATRTIYPQSWKLKIENNLSRQLGSLVGADGLTYACTQALFEGKGDISLEQVLYLEDLVFLDEMLANQAITSWSTAFAGKTLTLANGHYQLDSGAWPQFEQDVMQQTLKTMHTGATIA